jgi:hypothetical protein
MPFFINFRFCIKLTELLEAEDDDWVHAWSFAVSLMCNDDYISGMCINELLKVIEKAFKVCYIYYCLKI